MTASEAFAVCPAFIVVAPLTVESEKSIPVPDRLTDSEPDDELSETVSAPVREPPAVGLKETVIVQFAPAARLDPQLFNWLKSPLVEMPEIVRDTFPLFVSLTSCAAPEAPTNWPAKERVVGETEAEGAPPDAMPVNAAV